MFDGFLPNGRMSASDSIIKKTVSSYRGRNPVQSNQTTSICQDYPNSKKFVCSQYYFDFALTRGCTLAPIAALYAVGSPETTRQEKVNVFRQSGDLWCEIYHQIKKGLLVRSPLTEFELRKNYDGNAYRILAQQSDCTAELNALGS